MLAALDHHLGTKKVEYYHLETILCEELEGDHVPKFQINLSCIFLSELILGLVNIFMKNVTKLI